MAVDLLENISSKFPTLEVLEISEWKMTDIEISCQTLRVLTLENCRDLEVMEVDTPNLVSLHCRMNKLPFYSFDAPSLQEVELKFYLRSCSNLWFDELKKLVGKFNNSEGLNLVIHSKVPYFLFSFEFFKGVIDINISLILSHSFFPTSAMAFY